VTMTQLVPSQTPMIAMAQEVISGVVDIVVEPCVRIAHQGQVDLHEGHDLETVDLTHVYEGSGSPLLETPLFDQVAETDNLMGHLLPGPTCSDDDVPLIGQDDHSTCLDTSVWVPRTNVSSRVSAQEDTTAHIGYNVIQREIAVGDGVQWHTAGPSSTMDRGQFSTLSFVESVVGDSRVDTSSEGREITPQQDCDQESQYLAGQLRVSEDMIMVATRCIDDTHALVADCGWRASMAHDSSDGGFFMDDLHTLRERVSVMRIDYQQLLMDRDHLLEIGEMYNRALREQELEVDQLTHELGSTRGFLEGTQTTLQESKSRSEDLLDKGTLHLS
jgi:hypothetical protein